MVIAKPAVLTALFLASVITIINTAMQASYSRTSVDYVVLVVLAAIRVQVANVAGK